MIPYNVSHFDGKKINRGKAEYAALCIGPDNEGYRAYFTQAEKDLVMFFKTNNVKHKEKLIALIEEYAQEKFEEGYKENEEV